MTGTKMPSLEAIQACSDFEQVARTVTPAYAWDYIEGGEKDTISLNEAAFETLLIRPHVLADVSSIDLRCSVLGSPCQAPLYLTSIAKGGLVSQEGEHAFVRAAHRFGVPYIVPTISTTPHEDIFGAAALGQGLPYQFYLLGDNEDSIVKLKTAMRCGCTAVVITVDNNAPRKGALFASTQATSNVFPDPTFTWGRLEEVMALLPPGLPVYFKGIQTAEDAIRAVQKGARGIVVSNHGGRACGGCRSALASLEEVTACLRAKRLLGTIEILFDGGVRCGLDVFKALCLGATGVGVGRPYYWASAAFGEDGVVAALGLLSSELRHTMAQAGAPKLAGLSPLMLCRAATPHLPLRLSWDSDEVLLEADRVDSKL